MKKKMRTNRRDNSCTVRRDLSKGMQTTSATADNTMKTVHRTVSKR